METRQVITELAQQIRSIERSRRQTAPRGDFTPSGLPGLERLLGDAGWPRGCLVEWLAEGSLQVAPVALRPEDISQGHASQREAIHLRRFFTYRDAARRASPPVSPPNLCAPGFPECNALFLRGSRATANDVQRSHLAT